MEHFHDEQLLLTTYITSKQDDAAAPVTRLENSPSGSINIVTFSRVSASRKQKFPAHAQLNPLLRTGSKTPIFFPQLENSNSKRAFIARINGSSIFPR